MLVFRTMRGSRNGLSWERYSSWVFALYDSSVEQSRLGIHRCPKEWDCVCTSWDSLALPHTLCRLTFRTAKSSRGSLPPHILLYISVANDRYTITCSWLVPASPHAALLLRDLWPHPRGQRSCVNLLHHPAPALEWPLSGQQTLRYTITSIKWTAFVLHFDAHSATSVGRGAWERDHTKLVEYMIRCCPDAESESWTVSTTASCFPF